MSPRFDTGTISLHCVISAFTFSKVGPRKYCKEGIRKHISRVFLVDAGSRQEVIINAAVRHTASLCVTPGGQMWAVVPAACSVLGAPCADPTRGCVPCTEWPCLCLSPQYHAEITASTCTCFVLNQ